mmetsp:Transcript_9627/g.13237  ORF Transcript_9627/g.13237 Transcript_9627/m.13237 type:complete len:317 (-) Transcript_9627:321-1271(-)
MKLKIVTLTGVTLQLEYSQQITVENIKAELEKQIGFPREHISLVFRGKELAGEGLEQESIRKLFPDYTSSKDFFVLVLRRTARHKKGGNDKKRKGEQNDNSSAQQGNNKHHKTSDSSSGSMRRSSSAIKRSATKESKNSSSPGRPQLSNIHEMRDFLRKFGERRQKAKSQQPSIRTIEPKGEFLNQLTNMGFKAEAATRALLLHRNNLEMALNWLLENAGDPEINNPITPKERQQLSRVASRPAIPMEALNDFIEINFGADRSPSLEFAEGGGVAMNEEEESAAAAITAASRAAERTGASPPTASTTDPSHDESLV